MIIKLKTRNALLDFFLCMTCSKAAINGCTNSHVRLLIVKNGIIDSMISYYSLNSLVFTFFSEILVMDVGCMDKFQAFKVFDRVYHLTSSGSQQYKRKDRVKRKHNTIYF